MHPNIVCHQRSSSLPRAVRSTNLLGCCEPKPAIMLQLAQQSTAVQGYRQLLNRHTTAAAAGETLRHQKQILSASGHRPVCNSQAPQPTVTYGREGSFLRSQGLPHRRSSVYQNTPRLNSKRRTCGGSLHETSSASTTRAPMRHNGRSTKTACLRFWAGLGTPNGTPVTCHPQGLVMNPQQKHLYNFTQTIDLGSATKHRCAQTGVGGTERRLPHGSLRCQLTDKTSAGSEKSQP